MTDHIVVGWYTPDYAHWARQLRQDLLDVGDKHDLVEVPKLPGSWARNTLRKPAMVRQFRQRYPDHVLVLLDVDCRVRSTLSPLTELRGDVAARVVGRTKGRGKDKARIKIMSGTMVFRPTPGADHFVYAWERAVDECTDGDVDQAALMIAMARATGFSFEPLDARWCSFAGAPDPSPIIDHDNASGYARPTRFRDRLRQWALSRIPARSVEA